MNDEPNRSKLKDIFSVVNYLKIAIEDLNDRLDTIADRIEDIKKPLDLEIRAAQAIKILDKYEDYMKNIDKLNGMVNEMKGQVSLVRAAMNKTEKYQQKLHERYVKAQKILFNGCKETESE